MWYIESIATNLLERGWVFWYDKCSFREEGIQEQGRLVTGGATLSQLDNGDALGDVAVKRVWRVPLRGLMLYMVLALIVSAGVARAAEGAAGDKPAVQPQGLQHAGIYALRRIEPELTGAGVKIAIISRSITYRDGEPQNDYRPNIGHKCFEGIQLRFYDRGQLPAGVSPHATAICSILFGDDAEAYVPYLGKFRYQGVLPGATGEVYEFWHFLINNVFTQMPPGADVISASIGSQFEDWWTRGIESLAEHYGLTVVAGIGNGTESYDPPLYPGAGANVIGVGVVDAVNTADPAKSLGHFALAYPEHSSIGPTADGRCKPDIIAPGNCLAAGVGNVDGYEMTGNWSSFATPITAGVVGLLTQKARQDKNLSLAVSPNGGNCVMKAILMNSATKLPYWHKGRLSSDDDQQTPLDYIQGAGMVNALNAYRHLVAGRHKPGNVPVGGWDLNQLDDSTTANAYRIAVAEPAGKQITATVVWNRHYENVYPFTRIEARDTNLRLELWAVNPDNSGNDRLVDYSDSKVDNVEHIHCRAVAGCSTYEIVVSNSDADGRPRGDLNERYALAWDVSDSQDGDNIFWHDLNADGVVDEQDFAILLKNWADSMKSPGGYQMGDVNMDGAIDVNDLQVLLAHQNRKAQWRDAGAAN